MREGGGVDKKYIHSDRLGAVQLDADALADDLSRVHEILQDGVVHVGERARARARLLHTRLARLLLENAALGAHDHMLAAELLLQLTHNTALDAVEVLQQRHGDEDNDRLTASADIDLLGGGDVDLAQIRLQVLHAVLQISKRLQQWVAVVQSAMRSRAVVTLTQRFQRYTKTNKES